MTVTIQQIVDSGIVSGTTITSALTASYGNPNFIVGSDPGTGGSSIFRVGGAGLFSAETIISASANAHWTINTKTANEAGFRIQKDGTDAWYVYVAANDSNTGNLRFYNAGDKVQITSGGILIVGTDPGQPPNSTANLHVATRERVGGTLIGDWPNGGAGFQMIGLATLDQSASAGNYALLMDSADTYLNVPANGTIYHRINNVTYAQLNSDGHFEFLPPQTSGTNQSLQIQNGFSLCLSSYQDNNGGAAIFHNAFMPYNNAGGGIPKWVSGHSSFGARGIWFDYTGGGSGMVSGGIAFYADNNPTTASVMFTPTIRAQITNDGAFLVGDKLSGSLSTAVTGSNSNKAFGEFVANVTMSSLAASGVKPNGTIWIQY